MTTPSINPEQIEKTLFFLDRCCKNQREFFLNYLHSLFVGSPEQLPALVIDVAEGHGPFHLPALEIWAESLVRFINTSHAPIPKREIEVGSHIRWVYLYAEMEKKRPTSDFDIYAYFLPKQIKHDEVIEDIETITLEEDPDNFVELGEIIAGIPQFFIFLQNWKK